MQPTDKSNWWQTAGYWLAAWAIVGVTLAVVLLLASATRTWIGAVPTQSHPTTVAGQLHGMARLLGVFVAIPLAIGVASSLIVAFPLQVTALWLRRTKADPEVLAGIAMLGMASAIVSFLVFYEFTLPFALLVPNAAVMTAVLIGFYISHVLIVVIARWLIARRTIVPPRTGA